MNLREAGHCPASDNLKLMKPSLSSANIIAFSSYITFAVVIKSLFHASVIPVPEVFGIIGHLGFPVKTGIHNLKLIPCFYRDDVWIPA
jgi:hypothetical protein